MDSSILFRKITDKIGREMDINTFESFYISLDSEGVLSVQGCKSIRFCSENRIELIGYDRIVLIEGENMQVLLYSKPETVIKGIIVKLEFLKGDRNA